ncbi:hypothetical protein B0H16DRAFT_1747865 [Mycena metata]|uniref:Uncharacterized protein n=1 Tax=Mycena metata TaxID=1033252 RepID=A0AAD7GRN9_9AGAR|nr:hypothetical protein B0H16DRAFT_1747865 [Mycena metata]
MVAHAQLTATFYSIDEACELVIEHCQSVAERSLRLEPGCDIMGDVMEFVIRPLVYLLIARYVPANRHYLQRHELTMLELVFVHDCFHLLENGGAFPTEDQVIHGVSPADAPFLGFRGGCLHCLETLREMRVIYYPESATRCSPSVVALNLNRAVILGCRWNLIEPLDDFPAYLAPNTDEIIMGIESE